MAGRRRSVIWGSILALVATAVLATPLAASEPSAEAAFIEAINAERAAMGFDPLLAYWDLVDDARAHSTVMMSEDHLYHNPHLADVTTGWYGLGENVGVGPDVPILHQAFMDSPGHRDNILGDWNYIGVGVEVESEWKMWVTVVFMRGPDGLVEPAPAPPAPITPEPVAPAEPPGPAVDRDFTVGGVDPLTGEWHLLDAEGTVDTFYYGNPGDYPMVGDWDCDGIDTPGLYRQSDGYVYLRNSNTQGIGEIRFYFGNPSDVPLAGDFDGDGCDTVSIFRPSEGRVYVINELGADEGGLGAADYYYTFGESGEVPFVADFDGDGVDTVGMYDDATGAARILNAHGDGLVPITARFGQPGDWVVAGDWNDDGDATMAAFRPDAGRYYLCYEAGRSVADETITFGQGHWMPIAGVFYGG